MHMLVQPICRAVRGSSGAVSAVANIGRREGVVFGVDGE